MSYIKGLVRVLTAALLLTLAVAGPASAVFEDQRTWGGTCAGTANAQTVAIANFKGPTAGIELRCIAGATNTAAMTLNAQATGVKNVFKRTVNGPAALTGGEVVTGQIVSYVYDGTQYELTSSQSQGVVGGYRALKVTGTGDTTFTVVADALTLEDSNGFGFRALAVSVSCTISSSGANGFDTGSPSTSSWVSAWVIRNPTSGTTACLASASATSPTLPSGYTYKGRVGWLRYDATPKLWRSIQYGRTAQVVIGTNPSTWPSIASGSNGGTLTSTAVTSFVPTATASRILVRMAHGGAGATVSIASDSSTPAMVTSSTTGNLTTVTTLALITTNIYYASDNASESIQLVGWEDNL